MRRFFFRPSLLIVLSAAVVVGALVVAFQRPPAQGRPTPLAIAANEREIVWLYPATNPTSWERFVAAVRRTAERLHDRGLAWRADFNAAFPRQTTVVPEVSLSRSEDGPRFVFRWYKLTGDWKTRDWVEALLKRQPPPLAIIGGSSSDSARELATHLNHAAKALPAEQRPLLLLTSATADRVAPYYDGDPVSAYGETALANATVPLTRLYPERTFRFCFTNKQMAAAVSSFIWWHGDLRPDTDPVHLAAWNDDSYSRDLIDGFREALRQGMAQDVANQYVWLSNQVLVNLPLGVSGGIVPVQRLPVYPDDPTRLYLGLPPITYPIASSVGPFDTPNTYEAQAAGDMLEKIQEQSQIRPLLIVAGQSQPSRRFLRGLIRGVPSLSKREKIVVATGDAVSFNTVYRDRQVAWNVQDLPFPLVFFCHRNPIDAEAGFRPSGNAARPSAEDERDATAETGTEDLLLYGDIVEALVQTASPAEGTVCTNAGELVERLAQARWQDDRIEFRGTGVPLFDRDGQRQGGTGEHVVYLQPQWHGRYLDRLLPYAIIEVWAWRRRDADRRESGQFWQRRGEPLMVQYTTDRPAEGDPAHERR